MEAIIIYRLGSLGDTIVALPCFHRIAEKFPTAQRIVLTNVPAASGAAPLEAILGGSGLINGVISYPVGTRSPLILWRLAKQIRAVNATALIYLQTTRGGWFGVMRDLVFFRLCGVRWIIGIPSTADLRNCRREQTSGFVERECERLARTLSELGAIDLSASGVWDLLLTRQEKLTGDSIVANFGGSPFIAINMGGKASEKDWGVDRWTKLLAALAKSCSSYGLLVVGVAEESARANAVTQSWPNRVVDVCGRLSPRECAAALSAARIFVGHDSGPLHLAAANSVPCVGLFGNYNRPRRWHPYGDRHIIIHRMAGMSTITVEEVVRAVSALLPKQAVDFAPCVLDGSSHDPS